MGAEWNRFIDSMGWRMTLIIAGLAAWTLVVYGALAI